MELKPYLSRGGYNIRIVLIVPYGIETLISDYLNQLTIVLIVPYGIETRQNKRSPK